MPYSNPLYPLERAPVPIVQEAGRATEPAWKDVEGEKTLSPPGFEPKMSGVYQVPKRTTPYRLASHT